MSREHALGMALGFVADRLFGDPQRHHPVAQFGSAAAKVEEGLYADSCRSGVLAETVLVGGTVALGVFAEAVSGGEKLPRRALKVLLTAAATFTVLGGTTLGREAEDVAEYLEEDDLPGARKQVGRIVGRTTSDLDADEIARAAVETVAENTSDAVVAPLFWGGLLGIPGLLGYRAINTLDAMFGHKSARYRRFGWAAARTDDVANWAPARLTAALVALVRPTAAGRVWRTIRRDAAKHPSPNAGQVESAFAGALNVRLGGANTYDGQAEDRGTLGDGRSVETADIQRAVRLSRSVSLAALIAAMAAANWVERSAKGSRHKQPR